MLSTMTEQAPEGIETKDVYTTMADGGFETKDAGVPGYRPAAVPNADVVDPNKKADEGATTEESDASAGDSGGGETPAKKTARTSSAKSSSGS